MCSLVPQNYFIVQEAQSGMLDLFLLQGFVNRSLQVWKYPSGTSFLLTKNQGGSLLNASATFSFGLRFCLPDCCLGYCSFSCLRRWFLHTITIDNRFNYFSTSSYLKAQRSLAFLSPNERRQETKYSVHHFLITDDIIHWFMFVFFRVLYF